MFPILEDLGLFWLSGVESKGGKWTLFAEIQYVVSKDFCFDEILILKDKHNINGYQRILNSLHKRNLESYV